MKILNGADTEREHPVVKINFNKAPSDKKLLRCIVDLLNYTGLMIKKNDLKKLKEDHGAMVAKQQ